MNRIWGGTPKKKEKEIVFGGPTNVKHVSHMGFDPKTGFEVVRLISIPSSPFHSFSNFQKMRNLPPEWEALFGGLNDTLKAMGEKGVTKKEAQMLFAMASDALMSGKAMKP